MAQFGNYFVVQKPADGITSDIHCVALGVDKPVKGIQAFTSGNE